MDIISLGKAMKAKKDMQQLQDRLGMNGTEQDEDVRGDFASTKERLEILENNRIGLRDSQFTIDTDEEWSQGEVTGSVSFQDGSLQGAGTWRGKIDLGSDFVEFERITLEGENLDLVSVSTKTDDEVKPLGPNGEIQSKQNQSIEVKATLQEVEGENYSEDIAPIGTPIADGQKHLNNRIEYAFDDNSLGTNWESSVINADVRRGVESWIGVEYDKPVHIQKIMLRQSNYPYLIGVERWNDIEDSWQEIYQFVPNGGTSANIYEYKIPASAPSTKWRVIARDGLSSNNGTARWSIFTLQMMEAITQSPRIDKLTIHYKKKPLDYRIGEVERNTTINLNKYNLYVNSILNKDRYKMTDLVFDDFGDDSGIDKDLSSGYAYDTTNRKVTIQPGEERAEIVTPSESLEKTPNLFTISTLQNEQLSGQQLFDLEGGTFHNTEFIDGQLKLKVKEVR